MFSVPYCPMGVRTTEGIILSVNESANVEPIVEHEPKFKALPEVANYWAQKKSPRKKSIT